MNAPLRLPRDQMAAVRFEDRQLHLASRGWQLDAGASSPGIGVYRYPPEPDAEILRRDLAVRDGRRCGTVGRPCHNSASKSGWP